MTSLGDVQNAAKLRDIITRVAETTIDKKRPAERIGKVYSIDLSARVAKIYFPGDNIDSLIEARFAADKVPTQAMIDTYPVDGINAAGNIVRVAGGPGAYYILDYVSGVPAIDASARTLIYNNTVTINGNVNAVGAVSAANTAAINTLNNTTLPGLQTQLTTLNTVTIPGLQTALGDANADISALESVTIPALNTRLTTAESDITDAETALGTLNGKFPITSTSISDGAITTPKMTANTINGDRILANTLNALKIVAGSITTDRFTANTIDGSVVTANTMNASKLVAGSITTDRMTANTINGDRITFNTLQGDKILVNTLNGDRIIANTISGDRIIVNTLNGDRIIANSIAAAAIAVGDFTNFMAPMNEWFGAAITSNGSDTQGPVVVVQGNGSGNTHFNAGTFPVVAGDQFYFEWAVYANYAGFSGNGVTPYFQWLSQDQLTVVTATSGPGTPQGTNTYAVVGVDITVPANAYWCRVLPYASANGKAAIRKATVRRKNTGSLIVDGAIDGKTITGATIQTAASGARITFDTTGLKAYNASAQTFNLSSADGSILVGPATGTFPAQVKLGTFTNIITGTGQGAIQLISGGTGWGPSNIQAYIEPNSGSGTMSVQFNAPYPNAVNGFSAYALSSRLTLSTTFQGLSNANLYSNNSTSISCDASNVTLSTTTATMYSSTKTTVQGDTIVEFSTGSAGVINFVAGLTGAWLNMKNFGGFPALTRNGSTSALQFMDNRLRVVNQAASAFTNIEAAAFVVSSDRRSKKNPKPAPKGATERIRKLNAYDYTKDGSDRTERGFMADEVQKVLPHAVLQDEDSKLSLSLYDMLTEAYAAIQELTDRVEELEGSVV